MEHREGEWSIKFYSSIITYSFLVVIVLGRMGELGGEALGWRVESLECMEHFITFPTSLFLFFIYNLRREWNFVEGIG